MSFAVPLTKKHVLNPICKLGATEVKKYVLHFLYDEHKISQNAIPRIQWREIPTQYPLQSTLTQTSRPLQQHFLLKLLNQRGGTLNYASAI